MDDDGFIGLPPGMSPTPVNPDSGTVRRDRPERPRAEREEIVFFPVVPGVDVTPEPEPDPESARVPAPQPTEPFGRQELDEATRAALPRRHVASAWRLYVAGRVVPVDGLLYLGRNPEPTAEHPGAPVLAVEDAAKSVSKTHALLEVDGDTLWVHDLNSTNGVWVVPEGGDPVEVLPGRRESIPSRATLEIGEFEIGVDHG